MQSTFPDLHNQLPLSSSGNSIRWKRTRKSGGKHKLASGKTGQWQFGTVEQWQSGTVAQWHSCTVAKWQIGNSETLWYSGKVAKRYSGTLAKWHRGETGQWANNRAAWQMTSQTCWHSSSSTLLLFLGLSFNWHQTINWHLELEQVLVHRNVVDVILLDLKLCCFSETTCFLVVLVFGLSKVA